MSPKRWIFLSYRRAGGGRPLAARIQSGLEIHLGTGAVFVDSTGIEAGENWAQTVSESLTDCLVVFVVVTPEWPTSQLADPCDWVRREIRDSIRLGKLIVPLFMDGAQVPAEHTLPEDIREFANRQGYFVDSRSESLFRAATNVISDDIGRRCPATVTWERPLASWRQGIRHNVWNIAVDGAQVLELTDSDTRGTCQVPSGTRTLSVKWHEREHDRNYGQYMVHGYSSWGETPPLRVDFRPGMYTFTLRREHPTTKRNWFLRFIDNWNCIDNDPRSIQLASFRPASQLD